MTRPTNKEIIEAYKTTGSVWEAGKVVGMSGQGVWERLKSIDYPLASRCWTTPEVEALRDLAGRETIGAIAQSLGRPYYGVACMISRLGLSSWYGNRQSKFARKRPPYPKRRTLSLIRDLIRDGGSIRGFARARGLGLEAFVIAIQRHDPRFWAEFSKTKGIPEQTCYCGASFFPVTKKQAACSRRCAAAKRRDEKYFGGNRRGTIGLAEGVCQLCERVVTKGLSAHHILGKEHDPGNEHLIALCAGCHKAVTFLSSRVFVDRDGCWENLISLVLARRLSDRQGDAVAVRACVDLEWLTKDDVHEECLPTDVKEVARSWQGDGLIMRRRSGARPGTSERSHRPVSQSGPPRHHPSVSKEES